MAGETSRLAADDQGAPPYSSASELVVPAGNAGTQVPRVAVPASQKQSPRDRANRRQARRSNHASS